ncbi:MAG: hypothetical protein ACOYNL_08380 [Rickettsiales bacterium]
MTQIPDELLPHLNGTRLEVKDGKFTALVPLESYLQVQQNLTT